MASTLRVLARRACVATAAVSAAGLASATVARTESDSSATERARLFVDTRLSRFRRDWSHEYPLPPVVIERAGDRINARFKLPPNVQHVPLLLDLIASAEVHAADSGESGRAGPVLRWRVLGESEAKDKAAATGTGRYVGMRMLHLEGSRARGESGGPLDSLDLQLCLPPAVGGAPHTETREERSADGKSLSRTTVILDGRRRAAVLELTLPPPPASLPAAPESGTNGGSRGWLSGWYDERGKGAPAQGDAGGLDGGSSQRAASWPAGELLAEAYRLAHTAACAGGRAAAEHGAAAPTEGGPLWGRGGDPFRSLLDEFEHGLPFRLGAEPRAQPQQDEEAEGRRPGARLLEPADAADAGGQQAPASAEEAVRALSALGARVYLPPPPHPAPDAPHGRGGGAAAGAQPGGGLRSLFARGGGGEAAAHNGGGLFAWPGLGGYGGVKAALEEGVLLPLCCPQLYAQVRASARKAGGGADGKPLAPGAILFEGPPGTGKTSFARAAASAAGVPLVYAPLEALGSRWYGESEGRLAKLFAAARALAHFSGRAASAVGEGGEGSGGCILFLDEIDALALSRDAEMHEATRRSLSVLLRQLDGLDAEPYTPPHAGGVEAEVEAAPHRRPLVLIGATNRAADLDKALLSRFALTLTFPLPDADERAAIIGVHATHLSAAERASLAHGCEGASGRTIRSACDAAERSWAARLVRARMAGRAVEASAPPAEEYAIALKAQREAERHMAAAPSERPGGRAGGG